MKRDYAGRETESPVVPKKTCHACGQGIPLRAGNVVEGGMTGKRFQGVVQSVSFCGLYATVGTFAGPVRFSVPIAGLTRLHGYYRITERESMR